MLRRKTHNSMYQSGAALVVSLFFLLILTIIGITGMQVTSLEEKMAGNMRDRGLSFQAAEATLRFAENRLRTQGATLVYNCDANSSDTSKGLYLETCPPAVLTDATWASGGDFLTNSDGTLAGVKDEDAPLYMIQQLPSISSNLEAGVAVGSGYYRITSRGVGGTTTAVTILQSTFKP